MPSVPLFFDNQFILVTPNSSTKYIALLWMSKRANAFSLLSCRIMHGKASFFQSLQTLPAQQKNHALPSHREVPRLPLLWVITVVPPPRTQSVRISL
jgi:hypothetical protein